MTNQPRPEVEAARDWRRARYSAILRRFKRWWMIHDAGPDHREAAERELEALVEHLVDLIDEEMYRVAAEDKPPPEPIIPARGIDED